MAGPYYLIPQISLLNYLLAYLSTLVYKDICRMGTYMHINTYIWMLIHVYLYICTYMCTQLCLLKKLLKGCTKTVYICYYWRVDIEMGRRKKASFTFYFVLFYCLKFYIMNNITFYNKTHFDICVATVRGFHANKSFFLALESCKRKCKWYHFL